MTRFRPQRDERGTSTIEFILVLPILLIVFFVIVEMSRAWLAVNIVTTAAWQGARAAVVTDPFDPTPAIARINNILGAANLTPTSVSVTCEAPCAPGSQVQANVTITLQLLFPNFFATYLPALGTMTIGQVAVMRYE